jgi:hypothetical protein
MAMTEPSLDKALVILPIFFPSSLFGGYASFLKKAWQKLFCSRRQLRINSTTAALENL